MKKLLIIFLCLPMIGFGQTNASSFNGFALYNAQGSNTTYLIDENQQIAHTWSMSTECNYTVQLKENGNLVRGTKNSNNSIFSSGNMAAVSGRVQEIDPLGNIVWDYIYSNIDHISHHDLTLIGDNVLITAWEKKDSTELNAAGFSNASSEMWPTHFIELEDDGNGGAVIVWEWHIWDHMCQDTDPSKPNYVANISDNPELIDINMLSGGSGDWFHVNGVDYNEDLDQIVFSSRFASEIYIIDHSTTTIEAASHTGGNSGMGGDILYRWGNPSNYGISGTQVIVNAVHDARWITDDGRPNGGFLQIFNNSGVSNSVSAIDGIETPWDAATNSYLRTAGQAFTPSSYTTRYECGYGSASGQSASDRMTNGNIFVNASGGQGGAGVMYEVDSIGNLVWGPYNASSPKGFRYECDYPGIIALEPFMTNTSTTTCFNVTTPSWDCIQNTCVDPGTGQGTYALLSVCQNVCNTTGCTPDPQYTSPGFYPDSITGLVNAYVGQSYNEVITVIVGIDTVVDIGLAFPIPGDIESISLTSVTGLPSGFSYTCDPPSCLFFGGSVGCISIYSNQNPNNSGVYPLIFETTTLINNAPFIGSGSSVYGIDDYNINILAVTPSWDCDGQGICSDPGTGNGAYASLTSCQSNCVVITPTWDCNGQGNCSDPGNGQGIFTSLSACQSNCIVVTPTWDCDGQGNCSDPGNGQGIFTSLSACQSNCVVITPTWDCVSGVCVDLGLGTGIYSTQVACQSACIVVTSTWDCVSGVCVDLGLGTGIYSTQVACQSACVVVTPTWDCDGQGTCSDPGTGNGTYASLSACQANCNNVSVEEISLTNLSIYPNPSRDVFNVRFTSEDVQDLRVRIMNIIGEELINENLEQFVGEYTKQIDLTNNAKGIYFLEIETIDGMINKKLILQ